MLEIVFCLALSLIEYHSCEINQPNIFLIIADDVGHNDFSLHGSNQIPTPNIDALFYNSVILDRFYTQAICTPSRAALLTGKYPIRMGLQGTPISAGEDRSLPADTATLASHLKHLNYTTHLVGKWHLGAAHRNDTPTRRGFDTHYGYWNGYIGYFNHVAQQMTTLQVLQGLDFFDGYAPLWSDQGKYATTVFTEQSIKVIRAHDPNVPLFMVLAHLAGHAGEDGVELAVPDEEENNRKFSYIRNSNRRRYAGVISELDKSVGQIVAVLKEKNILDNSIIIFMADNGAQTIGVFQNWGSNWPLRGLKFTEFEGGVRGTVSIFDPKFKKTGYVNSNIMHLVDLLPTLYKRAGGDLTSLGVNDGIDQWETMSENTTTNRSEILLNINEKTGNSALISHNGQYKLLNGSYTQAIFNYDHYYGEDGRSETVPAYNISGILNSVTNTAFSSTMNQLTEAKITDLRNQLDLAWCRKQSGTPYINCKEGCLFDLWKDPCEANNLFAANPQLVQELQGRINEFQNELVLQTGGTVDQNADPKWFNNTWCTWLDESVCHKKIKSPLEQLTDFWIESFNSIKYITNFLLGQLFQEF